MHWLHLLLAILFEVAGTTCMKLSAGFSRWVPSVLVVVFYLISFSLLTLALRRLDVSVAYAIWSGVGVALIAAIGMVFFREPVSAMKFLGLAAIVFGVAVLRFAGGTSD